MTTQTPDLQNDEQGSPRESLGSQWKEWLHSVSKDLQPVLKEIIVFAIYILGDMFILWLAGFAIRDVNIPAVNILYDGLKISSVIVIAVHFLCNCIVELNKNRKNLPLELSQPLERGSK